ncbi:MAG: ketopantoate reductase family protein, partial [Alphaproteobacteria bacterium]
MPEASATTIAVVGAGAIGGWIAARLALAGKGVALVARGESLRRIERQGIRLVEEDERHTISLPVTDDPKQLGETDILVLAVKATALADAAETAAPLIGPRTVVVPMVNGVP